MGMTTDEAVLELLWLKKVNQGILETDAKELDVDSAWIKHWESVDKFLDVAIDTMRKYQKIEDIYYHQSGEALENSLRAVIEDGSN